MTNYQKVLLLLIISLGIYTFWPTEADRVATVERLDIKTSPSGQITIMGITLGSSTLQEAEELLDETPQRALFLTPQPDDKHKYKLEAYFEDLQLVLVLDASSKLIKKIERNPRRPFVFPSGVVKLGISTEELTQVKSTTISTLTYIPYNQIDMTTFEKDHQQPAETIISTDQSTHYLYPALGLDFTRPVTGSDILQFVPPGEFHRLRDPLVASTTEQHADAFE